MDLLPRGLGDLVPSHQMPVSWIFIKLTYNVLPKDGLRAGRDRRVSPKRLEKTFKDNLGRKAESVWPVVRADILEG